MTVLALCGCAHQHAIQREHEVAAVTFNQGRRVFNSILYSPAEAVSLGPDLDATRAHTRLRQRLDSPLTRTAFYEFTDDGIAPAPSLVVFSSRDTVGVVPADSAALPAFVSGLLEREPAAAAPSYGEAWARFFVAVQGERWAIRLVQRPEDLSGCAGEAGGSVPASVAAVLRPPAVQTRPDGWDVSYFQWDMTLAVVERIRLSYREGGFTWSRRVVGRYGEPCISL